MRDLKIIQNTVLNKHQSMLALFQMNMMINEELSNENDDGKLSTSVKVRNKINCTNKEYQAQGIEKMRDLLKPYKKLGHLDDIDVHLLRGIYEL